MLWSLRLQWALPLPDATDIFGEDTPDALFEALRAAPGCVFSLGGAPAVALAPQGVRAFVLLPRGAESAPAAVALSREWGGGGGPALVTSFAAVENVLLAGSGDGALALFAVADLLGEAAMARAGEGGAPPVVAPRAVIPREAGAPPAAVAGFACSVARRVGASEGPLFAARTLYVSLDSRELLRCEWAALRACLDVSDGGGGSGGGAPAPAPPFFRCALGGSPRGVAAVAAANPLVADLFFAPPDPAACFLGGGGGGAARDAIVAGGQGPPLAAYHVAPGAPGGEGGGLAALLGDALQRASGWLGGWLGAGEDKEEEEEEEEEGEDAGGASGGEGAGEAGPAAPPRFPPRAPLPRSTALPEATLADAERRVEALALDPTGRYLLSTDSWGRVALVECGELTLERLWKGYRGGDAAWAAGEAAGGRAALFALLHAPRRGLLEVWRAVNGARAASLKVARASRLLYGAPPPPPPHAAGVCFPPPLCLLLSVDGGVLAAHALAQQQQP